MLTKREKILLQVLAVLLLLAMVVSLLFTPALISYVESKAEKIAKTEEREVTEQIFQSPGIDTKLAEAKAEAAEHYEYFYSVLNSYTIDGIVNKLIQMEDLSILNLEIAPYEDASYDFVPPKDDIEEGEGLGDDENQEKVLVKSVITVQLSGAFQNILNFMDRLNETSTCLRIQSMTIRDSVDLLLSSAEKEVTLQIYVYGITLKPMQGELNTMLGAAHQIED